MAAVAVEQLEAVLAARHQAVGPTDPAVVDAVLEPPFEPAMVVGPDVEVAGEVARDAPAAAPSQDAEPADVAAWMEQTWLPLLVATAGPLDVTRWPKTVVKTPEPKSVTPRQQPAALPRSTKTPPPPPTKDKLGKAERVAIGAAAGGGLLVALLKAFGVF